MTFKEAEQALREVPTVEPNQGFIFWVTQLVEEVMARYETNASPEYGD